MENDGEIVVTVDAGGEEPPVATENKETEVVVKVESEPSENNGDFAIGEKLGALAVELELVVSMTANLESKISELDMRLGDLHDRIGLLDGRLYAIEEAEKAEHASEKSEIEGSLVEVEIPESTAIEEPQASKRKRFLI